jgi:hypothetical protein
MYTEKELNSLIADVEKEFTSHLAKAEESFKLAKSEDAPKKDESKEKDEAKASKESAGESKKPMETEKPEDKGAKDQDQQKAGENPLPKDGEPSEPQAGDKLADGQDEGHGYDDEDMNHMHSMYSSMSKGELKAHHDCIRKCMDGHGLSKCEDGMAKAETSDAAKDAEGYRPNGGPKDGEAAKAKTPATSDTQALNKSEKDIVVEEVSLLKSELEAVKAKSAEEKKNLETALQNFLTKFVEKTAPAGKAITSLDIIAKNEDGQKEKPLSKSEIDAKLLAKSKDSSTSTADRNAINSYYFSKNVESVRHLLS